jgi:kumamolisin
MNMREDAPVPARELPGSDRGPMPGARSAAGPRTEERIEVTLVLRRRNLLPDDALNANAAQDAVPDAAAFADRYGADPADLKAVCDAVAAAGATVLERDQASRRVRMSAPVPTLERLFGTSLSWVTSTIDGSEVTHRQRTGSLHVPDELHERVVAVLGLDDRPQARANVRIVAPRAVATSYTPPQLGAVYDFPAGTGAGRTIAIVELGGGYTQADLDAYFGSLSLATPKVTAVSVDGAANAPDGDPNGADGEVMLDIEVAGALAPDAGIVVYFGPNTDAGFLDAVSQAVHASPTPDAVSISWGQSESQWTKQARDALDAAFADAAALGVTVTVASGDDGSSDRQNDGKPHVDFPASSPHALACGGTTLHADPQTGTVTSEVTWNDGSGGGATGGGVSMAFPRPAWQAAVGVPEGDAAGSGGSAGRGVPDVAANADPRTGYRVRVDGQDIVIGGTSAVAPLWAALVARLNEQGASRLGLLQPRIYSGASAGVSPPSFRDVTSGDNGAYTAGPGWDACTGLGVPIGSALAGAPIVRHSPVRRSVRAADRRDSPSTATLG